MANDTTITVIGNLTSDPELRFTPSGAAVANFTIASTPRTFDKSANEWKDGETLFLRASIWRDAAENVATSLTKGSRVIAQGNLKARTYETRDGEKRTSYELDVQEIGASLRTATAQITRKSRDSQPTTSQQSTGWGQPAQPAQGDPWGGQQAAADWGTPGQSEPPF